MATTLVNYVVLAAVPDPRRGERVNIALVAFRPNHTDVRALKTFTKLRALDPNLDVSPFEDLAYIITKVTEGVDSTEERTRLLSAIPGMAINSKGQMLVDEKDDYQRRLNKLFQRHVLPPPTTRGQKKYSRLHSEIRRRFVREAWLGESADDIDRSRVVENFVLDRQQALFAQFAFKNGSLWVMETLDLRAASDQTMKHRFGNAAVSSLVFEEAKSQDPNAKAIAIYAAKAKDEHLAGAHLRILEREATRMFNYESKDDRLRYFDMVGEALSHDDDNQASLPLRGKGGKETVSRR